MAGRKYSNQATNRLKRNNALEHTTEKNERLGMAKYSPLTMLGKGVNRAAGAVAGGETARVIRHGIKANKIKQSRKK